MKSNLINKINRDKIIKIYKDFYYKNNDFQFIQVLNTKRTLKNEKDYDLYPSITNVIGTNNCLIE